MNWNKKLLSPKYFGEKLIFKCRFCHKKEHIENMIVPCSCLSLSHPKCLIKHCRMKSKHAHSGQKKAHSAFDFCQMCENTFCVKKEVKYVTRSPFRKSMFKNRSFKVGIAIISLISLLISVLSISERYAGGEDYDIYAPLVALLAIILLICYSIFLFEKSRIKI